MSDTKIVRLCELCGSDFFDPVHNTPMAEAWGHNQHLKTHAFVPEGPR